MSIQITITGNSTEELADKLLALAATFKPPIVNSPSVGDEKPKRTRTKATAEAEQTPEVAAQVAGEPIAGADTPAATPETTGAGSTTENAPAAAAEPLDFDKDIAPKVIKLVGAKGKPFVTELLSEFGVERASQVDEARWPELVAALTDAL